MVDTISEERRSWNMRRIRSKDTKPEMIVRSLLHKLGYRFRLHGSVSKRIHLKGVLPGKPDIVLAKYRTVIFVHGCFWHRHDNCNRSSTPTTNTSYWQNKFISTIGRDKKNKSELVFLGWKVLVIWECETKNSGKDLLMEKIVKNLAQEE